MMRQVEWLQESQWSPEQALEWARSKHRWPQRRFRVEGTAIGRSRLLTRDMASATCQRYGGRIVELIPLPSKGNEPRRTLNQSLAEDLGECPRCKAPARFPCRTPAGVSRKPHKAREAIGGAS